MSTRAPMAALAVVAGLVVALALFGSGAETGPGAPSTTFADLPVADPTTTTTLPRAVEVEADVVVVGHSELALAGVVHLITLALGDGSPALLTVTDTTDGTSRVVELLGGASDIALDASGTIVAHRAAGAPGSRRIAWLDRDAAITLDVELESFVWSGDESATAAWIVPESDGSRIAFGRADATDGLVALDTVATTPGTIAGFNSHGVWTAFADPAFPRVGFVEYTPRSGDDGWSTSADLAMPAASSRRALLAHLDTASWRWTFALGPDRLVPLATAPGDASAGERFAAISPDGSRIAFIGRHGPGRSWLEIHGDSLGSTIRLLLPSAVESVGWSRHGRHVVLLGDESMLLVEAASVAEPVPTVWVVDLGHPIEWGTAIDRAPSPTTAPGAARN